ncbi:hypothetical protein G9A89_009886 [Geosiphon pyriformis]|nr:hypothetical protein G9A89_009886 [Geosiphon pyriformis]
MPDLVIAFRMILVMLEEVFMLRELPISQDEKNKERMVIVYFKANRMTGSAGRKNFLSFLEEVKRLLLTEDSGSNFEKRD